MNSRSLETFSNTHFHSLNTRCRRGGDCGRPGQGFWRPFRRKSKTSLVSDATTDDQSSDDIIGDPSESDGIAVTWVKTIGGRRYANEDTTVFDSLWVGKGKASGIKPRKKRKNSEPKESPFQRGALRKTLILPKLPWPCLWRPSPFPTQGRRDGPLRNANLPGLPRPSHQLISHSPIQRSAGETSSCRPYLPNAVDSRGEAPGIGGHPTLTLKLLVLLKD